MSTLGKVSAFGLVVATLYCVDRFARVAAVMFVLGDGNRLIRADSPEAFTLSLFYTVPLILFFAIHESGHLLTAWACGVRTSGPYFLPMPTWGAAALHLPIPAIGTLGAFVRLGGASPEDRWRIAVMGPVLGLAWALMCVCVGSALSGGGPGYGVYVPHLLRVFTEGAVWHPLLLAGYAGVIVTGLNLVPFPGLDGWHLLTTFEHLSWWRRAGSICAWGVGLACLV